MARLRFLWPDYAWPALAILAVLLLAGCGGASGQARLPVTGRVLATGGETVNGSVSFIPAKGNDGLGATCALKNGAYRFDRTDGPSAGAHEVIIRRAASKPTIGSRDDQARNEWTVQAEVPARGPYKLDFKLD